MSVLFPFSLVRFRTDFFPQQLDSYSKLLRSLHVAAKRLLQPNRGQFQAAHADFLPIQAVQIGPFVAILGQFGLLLGCFWRKNEESAALIRW